ncbi:hypothetical protein WA158_004525 [Blastocystis sp. Blastoise]
MDDYKVALPVPKSLSKEDSERLKDGGAPQSALEYMYMVSQEAKNYADVLVSNKKIKKHTNLSNLIPKDDIHLNEELTPTDDWIEESLELFDSLRTMFKVRESQKIPKNNKIYPHKNDEKSWHHFCFPSIPTIDSDIDDLLSSNSSSLKQEANDDDENIEEELSLEEINIDLKSESSSTPDNDNQNTCIKSIVKKELTNDDNSQVNVRVPTLTMMYNIDQIRLEKLLTFQIEWLTIGNEEFTMDRCIWLYAILARIEEPFSSDIYGNIRSLYKYCVQKRNEMIENSPTLPHINLLLYITSLYFKQGY